MNDSVLTVERILDAAEEGETPVTLVEVGGKGFVHGVVE